MRFCKVCRVEVKRGYLTHRHSVRHRHAKMLSRWLADESVTFAEMSRRLGVSRERVRQLAGLFPKIAKGRERQRRYAVTRSRLRLAESRGPVARVIRELEARRITWHPLPNTDSYGFSGRVIRLGQPPSVTCSVQSFGKRPTGYFNINKAAKKDCDFYLFVGPAGILVFPASARPRSQTTFMLMGQRKAKGVPGARHDWKQYLHAWHLIEERLKNNRRKSN